MSAYANGNSYVILNARSRTAVDLDSGNPAKGTKVTGWEFFPRPGAKNQVWTVHFTQKDENNYQWCQLVNAATGTLLDLRGGKADNGTPVQGWAKNDSANSQWTFWPVLGANLPVYV